MSDFRKIETASYAKVDPPASFGRPPKLEWLAIRQLVIDPEYQREITGEGRGNVRRIAAKFNWSMFGTVVVAAVGANTYAIIDGQHRTTAAALCGIEKVPCQIIEAVRSEQAAAFRAINGNVTKLNSMQLHHAAAAAGEDDARLLNDVCAKADCIILRYPKPWNIIQAGETMAVAALRRAIKKFGPDVTATALRCIRDSSDGNPGQLRVASIIGTSEVLADHPDWVERGGELIEAFDNFDVGDALEQAAAAAARIRGSSTTDQYESRLVEALSAFFAERDSKRHAGGRR